MKRMNMILFEIMFSSYFILVAATSLGNIYETTNNVFNRVDKFQKFMEIDNNKYIDMIYSNKLLFTQISLYLCIALSLLSLINFKIGSLLLSVMYIGFQTIYNNYFNLLEETNLKEFENLIITVGIFSCGLLIFSQSNLSNNIENYSNNKEDDSHERGTTHKIVN